MTKQILQELLKGYKKKEDPPSLIENIKYKFPKIKDFEYISNKSLLKPKDIIAYYNEETDKLSSKVRITKLLDSLDQEIINNGKNIAKLELYDISFKRTFHIFPYKYIIF